MRRDIIAVLDATCRSKQRAGEGYLRLRHTDPCRKKLAKVIG